MTNADIQRWLLWAATWGDPRYRARILRAVQEDTLPPAVLLALLRLLFPRPWEAPPEPDIFISLREDTPPDLPGGQTNRD